MTHWARGTASYPDRLGRRKHGVNKRNALAAMRHSGVPILQPGGSILFVGRDADGRLTEVAVVEAVEGDQVLVIIHAMPVEWER